MLPITVTKFLAAASSTGIGTFSSAATTVTLSCATFAQGRRVVVWGSSFLGGSVTITGLSETGTPQSETVLSSTVIAAVAESIQDYIQITGVTISCGVTSTAGYLGTSSRGGTPWYPVDTTRNPINLAWTLDVTSPTTVAVVSFEYSNAYPSYNPITRLWNAPSPTIGPIPTISSLGSSVTADTNGFITTPIAAWRITLSASSSGAGSVNASVIQSG